MNFKTYEHSLTVTVGATNLEGNVYWTNHLEWFGIARELFLFSLLPAGVNPFEYLFSIDTVVITKSVELDYKKPIFLADKISLKINTCEINHASLVLLLEIENQKGEVVASGKQKIAFATIAGKIKKIPEILKEGAREYQQK
jgi:acyl-CoA thioesterase FadM